MANTKTIGEATEAFVLAAFVNAGFPVALPFGENQRYDLVIEVRGEFKRVQCKTARTLQGGSVLCFNTRTWYRAQSNSYRNQADLFAVYSPHTKQVYVLPVDEVGETGVWLRLTASKNHQELGVRYAEEHAMAVWAQQAA